ncbi:MAG: glycosyltransferase family 2 protein [Alphaproteobacteria bacterium]|nr:glycosyltransferase family 2 protein [Alphaproteobacteria bacterium]
MSAPDVTLCICSYRRPEIVETLAALSRNTGLATDRLQVVVADNTQEGRARDLVALASEEFRIALDYVHAPANNISIARNACLDAAKGRWIAFLDDDELPAPGWLKALMQTAEREGFDVVLGPVTAVYPDTSPRWLVAGDFHSTRPVRVRGEIVTAYTGNVLFRRDAVEKNGLRFRLELGATGGEDEDFFYRLRDAGGRIGFDPRAVCYERVPVERAGMRWLLRRSFRAGQSHGRRLETLGRTPFRIGLASLKCVFCGVAAVVFLPHAVSSRRYLIRAALHGGVVARLSGLSEIRMY